MNRSKSVFKFLLKAGIITAYIGLIVILILQALTPGSESSNISQSVGDKVNNVVTDINQPNIESVDVEYIEIVSVTISGKKYYEDITLSIGESGMVNGKVYPENAANQSLIYSSSDEQVVEVYSTGKIVAKSKGSATIKISSSDNKALIDEITVKVTEVRATKIEIQNISDEIHVDERQKLGVKFTPKNTSDKTVKWESSDASVLTVDKSGYITAKKEGTATITVTSLSNSELTANVKITVLPKTETPIIPVDSIKIAADSTVGYIGSTIKLTAKIYPTDAKGNVVWYSSDEDIAEVSQNGTITCLKAGKVTITAKYGDAIESSINITVKEVLSKSISLDFKNITPHDSGYIIKQGESGKVIATLDEDATIFDIMYSSSNESVAKIGSDGVIEALAGGETVIKITTSYDGETTEEAFLLYVDRITLKDTIEDFYYVIRKSVGHFGAFLVLGILGALTYYIIFNKSLKGKLISFCVTMFAGFAVAGITEILQLPYFTEGRYCSFDDVMLDFNGYCFGSIPIFVTIVIAHLVTTLINKNKK